MMALKKKERSLVTMWYPQGGPVTSVVLTANALSLEEGYLIVAYEFANFPAWQQEQKSALADGL